MRRGKIGEDTYQQVEALTSGGMKRQQAFRQIGTETGRSAGAVSANYYRIARLRRGGSSAPVAKDATRAVSPATREQGSAEQGSADSPAAYEALDHALRMLKEILRDAPRRRKELDELRATYDALRDVLR
jgi:hypothetical protein